MTLSTKTADGIGYFADAVGLLATGAWRRGASRTEASPASRGAGPRAS